MVPSTAQRPLVLKKAADRLLASPTEAYHTFCTMPGLLAGGLRPVHGHQGRATAGRPRRLAAMLCAPVEPEALAAARARLAEQVDYLQGRAVLLLHPVERPQGLRQCNQGVQLVGDIPIYVSPGFQRPAGPTRSSSRPMAQVHLTQVAGCPPDAFAADGQLWGNPLYDWPSHRGRRTSAWWKRRIQHATSIYDVRPHRPLPRL